MQLTDLARLYGYKTAWEATRSQTMGRRLIQALNADDEDVRVTAGMLLTRAGSRAEPLLFDALQRRENVPAVLEVLGSIGDEAAARAIERHVHDPDPEIVRAAEEARRVVEFGRSMKT